MIYLSIPKAPFAECLALLNQVEAAEIRLDLNDYSMAEIKQIFCTDIPTIATCRAGKHNDIERISILKTAISAGASIVDIEIEADENYKKELIAFAKKHDCEVIISYHNFSEIPSNSELEQILSECFSSGADIAKIACYANYLEDTKRMINLYSSNKSIIAIAMGELGKESRVSAALNGAKISFAAISRQNNTAEGQYTYQELSEILKNMKDMQSFKIMAVTGNPILHSRSPQLFNSNLELSESGVYTRIVADSADEALNVFHQIGLSGMNVTAPFKNSMLQILDEIDSLAKQISGVNCVYSENDLLCGFNSDLFGVSDSFKNRGIDLAGKSVLILGAGGASQAAVCALTNEKSKICIVNRTIEKAKVLAQKYNCNYAGLDDLQKLLRLNSIVVSTLASEHNVIKPEWLHSDLTVFDADYKQAVLAEMAEKAGCIVIRGEEWLLNQAVPAYRKFIEQEPDISLMRRALNSTQALNKSRIILTGFMGSGKTTVGKILAKILGWQFLDTDQLIEAKMQKTIAEIFATHGEDKFRRMESEILREVAKTEKTVIASGGGIVLAKENRSLLKKEFLPIWLFAKPETAISRVNKDIQNRPLLNCANSLDKAKDLFNRRRNAYALSCELIVNAEIRTPEQVAEKIYDEFRRIL